MLHNTIQKYFSGVLTWLRNYKLFEGAMHFNFLVAVRRLFAVERKGGTFEAYYLRYRFFDPNTKKVVERVAVGKNDDDGTPQRIWINVTLPSAETMDESTRRAIGA